MECFAIGSCADSQFTFLYTTSRSRTTIKAATDALYDSTITIDNSAVDDSILTLDIDCGEGNCAGATFVFINVEHVLFHCDDAECGADCTVSNSSPPYKTASKPVSCDTK